MRPLEYATRSGADVQTRKWVPTPEQKALIDAYISVEARLRTKPCTEPVAETNPPQTTLRKEEPEDGPSRVVHRREDPKVLNPALERFMKRTMGSVRKIVND